MHEGREVWHLLTLVLFYHERHHGLKLHHLGKLDSVVLLQPTEVIDDRDIDKDVVLRSKEVLEIIKMLSTWHIWNRRS